MGSFPEMHFFRLADGGVQCGERGLFIGSTPMLRHSRGRGDRKTWFVRRSDDLDRELSEAYGLPIDVAAKREALANIARALTQGDLALAQIATLLQRFPDPPSLAKGAPTPGSFELAERLFDSGLLKGAWDESLHPRTGEAPNRGWFAIKPDASRSGASTPGSDWPSKVINFVIRSGALEWMLRVAETDPRTRTAAMIVELTFEALVWLRNEFPDEDVDAGQARAADQIHANFQPPRTLAELQTPPQDHLLGYELHHIVEENPANVAKDDRVAERARKFGYDALDDPSNVVYVPRLKHELVTAAYNSAYLDNPAYPRTRVVVSAMAFNDQREAGLRALREAGVLQ